MILHEGTLDSVSAPLPFDLVATSNIFDTSAPSALTMFLHGIMNITKPGSTVIVRSLFREALEWPAPPDAWTTDLPATRLLQDQDRSPLCRVSLVVRRSC